ncbi:SH3 domain-containing protein [Massilia sp.]|uniref:SH3 domain-containing protein n=1 Tax=Massilia sp. TaxID=1882437 RepID=UPI0028AD97E8|nr:SH3 domain-containing protein [Massilia sp.]
MPAALSAFACYGAALVLTLALAAWLTPRAWWRRPNARALAVLVAGTGAIGTACWWIAGPPASAPPPQAALHQDAPRAGGSYRVADALNLRAGAGVDAARLAVLPAGAVVTATGAQDGDWWEVRAERGGAVHAGWASSLWLRRADEPGR